MTVNFRDRARDTITGFEGTVVGKTTWLNGCVRYALQSSALKDGTPVEMYWVDAAQIEVVVANDMERAKPSGGPQADPHRRSDPRR